MDATLIKALQLVLSLSILVVLHEGGHFFFSKLFRVKVEKFFLFFDPYFHLFSTKDKWFTRLFPKCKDNETAYGIGWLPFGGYVKIAGMIDESMDTEQMKKPVQPWEFRAKPAWQRLLIMIGGVVVNFLLALFIHAQPLFSIALAQHIHRQADLVFLRRILRNPGIGDIRFGPAVRNRDHRLCLAFFLPALLRLPDTLAFLNDRFFGFPSASGAKAQQQKESEPRRRQTPGSA